MLGMAVERDSFVSILHVCSIQPKCVKVALKVRGFTPRFFFWEGDNNSFPISPMQANLCQKIDLSVPHKIT